MLSSESGLTLPEVLVTMVIAMVLSLATFGLVDTVMGRAGDISSRVDVTQRGRTAMDQITRNLRSQVCAWRDDATPPMLSARALFQASSTSVSVFVDFSDEALVSGKTAAPELRQIELASNIFTEKISKGAWSAATASHVIYNLGTKSRRIIDRVAAPADGIVFRYYAFDTANPPQPTVLLPTTRELTPAEMATVAKIGVSYRVLPQRGKVPTNNRGTTLLKNEVFVRNVDPNDFDPDNPIALTPSCPMFQ